MDGRKFDDVARALATGASRRKVLKILGGGGAIAAGIAATSQEAGATPMTGTCHAICQHQPKRERHSCYDCCRPSYDYCVSKCGDDEMCIESCVATECVGITVNAAPAAVWQALSDSTALSAWIGDNDLVAEVGRHFQLRSSAGTGAMSGEIVAVEPGRRLAFSWQGGHLSAPTTVAINLEPIGDGSQTRLRLEHAHDAAVCRATALLFGRTWQKSLFSERLPTYLAKTQHS